MPEIDNALEVSQLVSRRANVDPDDHFLAEDYGAVAHVSYIPPETLVKEIVKKVKLKLGAYQYPIWLNPLSGFLKKL
jgi:hypothetical protein